ncbi:Protein LONGIFOLIA [Melia azedarach]|uniref:Protein LONGIFOLIA n=1 Tax=Melia azedarach TaxID=155640 RepID=A0ACC1X9B8_MELAZ|nr:Protein LONGIFOLIA [Melia azedarach]
MSAKLLHSLSDENPDLQKQIGCMNGIFQLFDRHRFLSGRRIHHNQKRLLPPGRSDNHETKPNNAVQRPKEKNPKKTVKEKQRISTESSRTSFSSSSCSSSFSSVDNKHSQLESSSYGHTNFPGISCRDIPVYQPNNSLQLSRQPVDIRDIVKDSMYREARELSIKTASKENAGGQTLKYMDSPRPLHQPKSVKSRVSGPSESFRVLSKLRDDGFAAKDAPRFSYDGRESREGLKSTIKLKELPRLSLDSRERSMRGSTTEMKSNYLLEMQRVNGNSNNILNHQQEPGSYKRPSSVVAKLMGLEAFPDSMSTNGDQPNQMKTIPDVECDAFTRLSRTTDENKQTRTSGSPRNSVKEPASPRMKNANSLKKPTASSKFPIEPAPWKQPDGKIEKRLAQLEFKKSGKDLRALKQILEAMQKTKEILEIRKEDQASNFAPQTGSNYRAVQSSKLANSENLKGGYPTSTSTKGTSSPKSFRSPIVIMKTAKPMEKASNSASLATQNESLSNLQRLLHW